jgi:hypothetical protein
MEAMRLADLTGFADGPAIEPPPGVVAAIERMGEVLRIDAMARVTERAEIWSYGRNGATSCGGATRLLRADDDWIALSLTRSDDEALMPAWIGVEADWDAIEPAVASNPQVRWWIAAACSACRSRGWGSAPRPSRGRQHGWVTRNPSSNRSWSTCRRCGQDHCVRVC